MNMYHYAGLGWRKGVERCVIYVDEVPCFAKKSLFDHRILAFFSFYSDENNQICFFCSSTKKHIQTTLFFFYFKNVFKKI